MSIYRVGFRGPCPWLWRWGDPLTSQMHQPSGPLRCVVWPVLLTCHSVSISHIYSASRNDRILTPPHPHPDRRHRDSQSEPGMPFCSTTKGFTSLWEELKASINGGSNPLVHTLTPPSCAHPTPPPTPCKKYCNRNSRGRQFDQIPLSQIAGTHT